MKYHTACGIDKLVVREIDGTELPLGNLGFDLTFAFFQNGQLAEMVMLATTGKYS